MSEPDLRPTVRRLDEDVRAIADDIVEIREALDEHTATLARHGSVLDEHTVTLARHGSVLDEHTATLARHGSVLDEHTVTLARHGSVLDEQSEMLREVLRRLEAS